MKMIPRSLMVLFLLGALLSPVVADELDDLKKRIRGRAPALAKLKTAAKLGETDQGYVAPVKGTALADDETKLMQTENRDRKAGYGIIGKKRNLTAAKVGQLSGAKKIQSAKAGEWVKQGSSWKQK